MPQDRNRPLYYVALTVDSLAFQVQSVAIAWHVFTLRHRPFDLGLVGLALFLPVLIFALPAGIFTDRYDRRAVAAGAIMIEALAIGAFVFAVVARVRSLDVYLAILVIIGTMRAFSTPAARTLLVSIVSPQDYLPAQALASSIRQLTVIAGPALGGVLVALSTPFALTASATAMFLSAMLIPALHIIRPADTAPPRLREAFEGVRFIWSRPVVAGAISLDLFAVLFGGATALLPAFADGIFHAGPTGLGALRSAPAVGAALVAAVLARRPLRRHVGPTLLFAVSGFGLATIGFGISKNFVLTLVLLALVGGTDMVSVVIRNGLVQLGTPDAMRGRVNAVENVFIGASNELGEFESGTLANFIGVVPAVVAGGVGTLAVIALWGMFFPALRRADRFG
ncbi:MAG: MFS transporter [Candidatus Eremiobacteraeota bacterium]|nr:MFS transporter [Candidatus Eremiobacteraeota bacterium]MBC5803196.1 MFS transporter [Candidatus Eremiobacteraeota bacterium]MBC5821244.1 MFS transporter [Candidatus Eremiobacteraeota bacterium]